MKFMLSQRYKWDNMYKDIEEFCKKCTVCMMSGERRVNINNRTIITKKPNEMWEIDLIGRIPDGDTNKFIFIAIDHYSKWIEACVIDNKSAADVCNALKLLIFDKHGIPEKILVDCGLEFRNKDVEALQKKYSFEIIFSSPYHHKTMGAIERANRT
ncbi:MAG: integrase, partial [Fusobacteriaceae bacterium]